MITKKGIFVTFFFFLVCHDSAKKLRSCEISRNSGAFSVLWVGQLELSILQESKCGELLWLGSAACSSLVPSLEIRKVKLEL